MQVRYSPELSRTLKDAHAAGRLNGLYAALNALSNVPWWVGFERPTPLSPLYATA